jgi:hypothetical protein
MCNDYRLLINAATIFEDFSQIRIKIRFSEGKPNIEAREDIKITDTAPIVRAVEGEPGAGDLVQRRWSWPGQNGKPVYNFRSEGREFASPLPDSCRWLLRVHRSGGQKEEAEGQVAVHQDRRALVLHRRNLADRQRRRRGLLDVDDASRPRHRALP